MGTVERYLILGGIRSGKSIFGEELLQGVLNVTYLATSSRGDDPAHHLRILEHQARRPIEWTTLEIPDLAELPGLIAKTRGPLMVDSLGSITTRMLLEDWDERGIRDFVTAICRAVGDRSETTVLVSEEVGLSLVPNTELGRRFCDLHGLFNQEVGRACDQVILVVAGRGLPLLRTTALLGRG